MTSLVDETRYPQLHRLVCTVLENWPEHERFLGKSLAERDARTLAISEQLSFVIGRIATTVPKGLAGLCDDYRYFCEQIILPEEIHFRRNGAYRLSSFADAERECYSNPEFMEHNMNGLLLSDVLWANHASAFDHFVNAYLPQVQAGSEHLEIGTGHGIFLYFAAQTSQIAAVHGWDVSQTSIDHTRAALDTLDLSKPVQLTRQDLFDAEQAPEGGRFDSVVMSEILEHLEDPVAALQSVSRWMKPGGQIWINVPANSPAPDHIFLFESVEHACDIARQGGLEIVESAAFPMSGATLERAIKRKLSVSCIVTARKPVN